MHSDDKTPAQVNNDTKNVPEHRSTSADIASFLSDVRAMVPSASQSGRGRLIFAMDATMSRQPTWDMALGTQATMFEVVKQLGGLEVQLVFFRGFNECQASKWAQDPEALARLMTKVSCQGGYTQIGKVLRHARKENTGKKIGAVVYVGDCVEEDIDELCAIAGELGLLGVPLFIFQEGHNPEAQRAFVELARLSKGAYCRFNAGAAEELKALLSAAAAYAAGGKPALENLNRTNTGAQALLEQLK